MPAPLRFALIGAGRIGRVHASTIAQHPAATLVLVCDPVAEASLAGRVTALPVRQVPEQSEATVATAESKG